MTLLDNEKTFLGGLLADLRRIASTLAIVGLLTAFIALLFAPAMEGMLCSDLHKIAGGDSGDWRNPPSAKAMDRATRTIKLVRRGLWVIAAATWMLFFAMYCHGYGTH